jgi:hypothetical protein
MFTEREKSWLYLTRRFAIACATVFVALMALAGYAALRNIALSDYLAEHEGVGEALLLSMQVVGLMTPVLVLAHGAIILRALLRK